MGEAHGINTSYIRRSKSNHADGPKIDRSQWRLAGGGAQTGGAGGSGVIIVEEHYV